jgi:hypothetical protein
MEQGDPAIDPPRPHETKIIVKWLWFLGIAGVHDAPRGGKLPPGENPIGKNLA